MWVRRHSPDVKAFELLEWVDLGETRSSRDGVDGWIDFTDGVHPGTTVASLTSITSVQVSFNID